MINMTGKVLGILLAVLATVISVPSAALLTMFAAEALKGGPDAGIFTILAVSMAALDITVFVLMYWANRRYDEAEGYRNDQDRIGRWVRYLLFGNLVTVFLMMMIEVSISHPEWTERAPWLLTALLFAAVFASVIFLSRYGKYAARRRRIRNLQYALSSCGRRRFRFTVYEAEGQTCRGYVQGKVMANDQVYVNMPGKNVPEAGRIIRIMIDGKEEKSASGRYAEMTVECAGEIIPYTVISTHYTMHQTKPVIQAENPHLSGIISVYSDHYANDDYIGILNYDICHGEYLVPARRTGKTGTRDMMDPLNSQTSVSFYSVNTAASPDEACLPVFTDWDALSRYGFVIEDPQSTVLIMNFDKCRRLTEQGYSGIVIDPFGPRPFYLGRDYIATLISLKGYQEEFPEEADNE